LAFAGAASTPEKIDAGFIAIQHRAQTATPRMADIADWGA
jgi:hypothetical protein